MGADLEVDSAGSPIAKIITCESYEIVQTTRAVRGSKLTFRFSLFPNFFQTVFLSCLRHSQVALLPHLARRRSDRSYPHGSMSLSGGWDPKWISNRRNRAGYDATTRHDENHKHDSSRCDSNPAHYRPTYPT